jgi:hypothetical protein
VGGAVRGEVGGAVGGSVLMKNEWVLMALVKLSFVLQESV